MHMYRCVPGELARERGMVVTTTCRKVRKGTYLLYLPTCLSLGASGVLDTVLRGQVLVLVPEPYGTCTGTLRTSLVTTLARLARLVCCLT